MNSVWRIPDFLDLEYFFIQDRQLAEDEGEAFLRDRDRELYLNGIAPETGGGKPDRKWLVFRWLQERRRIEYEKQGPQAMLPGRMWYELYGLFWSVCSFLAVAVGGGAAYSSLSYSGEQPVNVSLFFLLFVVSQLLLLLVFLFLWGWRWLRGLDLRSSLLLTLVNKGLNGLLFKVRRYGIDGAGEVRRAQFAATLSAVRRRSKGYGALFFWPLFLLFQLFGIAFNFGVLGAVLVKVATADLAFGWQSTIQLSSQFVARLVELFAAPWSWLLGPESYPGLGQVEGSRMILKDGFYHLASTDLVSWWPFLCLAVCCYGLLPRVILFFGGSFFRKRALAAVSFRRGEHNQLLHRLLTPRLETTIEKAAGEVFQGEQSFDESRDVVQAPVAGKDEHAVNGALLAFIPDELFDECKQAELENFCHHSFVYTIYRCVRMDEQTMAKLGPFSQLTGESPCPPLFILHEAWQPPIQEMLWFLNQLRQQCDTETPIIVALVGRPTATTIFTPVSATDLKIWQQKTMTLEDPWLQLSPLVGVA